jgi:hypothetical protein
VPLRIMAFSAITLADFSLPGTFAISTLGARGNVAYRGQPRTTKGKRT